MSIWAGIYRQAVSTGALFGGYAVIVRIIRSSVFNEMMCAAFAPTTQHSNFGCNQGAITLPEDYFGR